MADGTVDAASVAENDDWQSTDVACTLKQVDRTLDGKVGKAGLAYGRSLEGACTASVNDLGGLHLCRQGLQGEQADDS